MKKTVIITLIACLTIVGLTSPVRAQPVPEMVTIDEARTVAQNWIALIIQREGSWGGSETAELDKVQEFKRGERVLGYFGAVKPQGFIVISLRKELAPVKAHSAVGDLDPESDEGMADLIKGGMERTLDAIEAQLGPLESVRTEDLENILEIDYRQSWGELGVDVATFRQLLSSDAIRMNYGGGDPPLLSSAWHQGPPYNDDCPLMGCGNSNGRAVVGCVATAGAQIMYYWAWPPVPYDWPNMRDTVTTSSPQAQIDAVAELNYNVGVAVEMDYGCSGSGADTDDMVDVYMLHLYATNVNVVDRDDFSYAEWINRIKSDLNVNRPLQYRIPGHSIVIDGWRENGGGTEFHINYGWGGTNTAWYTLNTIPGTGDPDEEYMVEDIFPAPVFWGSVSGTYPLESFSFRYFDRDTTGDSATFESGQNLQFLPGITVTCTSTTGGSIRFEGTSTDHTVLFTRGDTSQGILISEGVVKLRQGGSIKFP